MQENLRYLSSQIINVQEEERKRISRELHDVIAQTLTGINVRLATLKKERGLNARGFDRNITRTQQLVEKSGLDFVVRRVEKLGNDLVLWNRKIDPLPVHQDVHKVNDLQMDMPVRAVVAFWIFDEVTVEIIVLLLRILSLY